MSEPPPEPTGSPWATVSDARAVWTDKGAPLDDEVVARLLRVTYPACYAFARPIPLVDDAPGPVPESYTHANVLAARDLWRHAASRSADPLEVEVPPLEPEVRQLLRPRLGRPTIT